MLKIGKGEVHTMYWKDVGLFKSKTKPRGQWVRGVAVKVRSQGRKEMGRWGTGGDGALLK